ncbi:hypothetical protein FRB95_012684 [Tulasnella sp. JGI-2019a]|nr:hypothetical protein FRB95_012684 [Tulasnella sp. JGI-2019a]
MSPVNSTDMTPVDHSVMYLNNYVQKMNLLWRKEAKADDEKRGLGWSATIHVGGTPYGSVGYHDKKIDALASAARRALIDLGVDPSTGKW